MTKQLRWNESKQNLRKGRKSESDKIFFWFNDSASELQEIPDQLMFQ